MRKRAYQLIAFIFLITLVIIFSYPFLTQSITGLITYTTHNDFSNCYENISCQFTNWQSGKIYCLNQSQITNQTCFNITQENITINGQGFKITYGNQPNLTTFHGIYSNKKFTLIKNLNISKGNLANSNDLRYAIYFENVSFGEIKNINTTNNSYGVYLNYGSNNNLINLTIKNNKNAIYLINSSQNNLTNINLKNNLIQNLYLDSSLNNNLLKILSINSNRGIKLISSYNNSIKESNFSNNTLNFDLEGTTLQHFYNEINTQNIIDYNKKIYYNYSISNTQFNKESAPNAGMLLCANCTNITIMDLNLIKNNIGLYLYKTNNSLIKNINSSENAYGIKLDYSNNNTLVNIKTNYNNHGINLFHSSNNNLTNIFTKNNNDGLFFYPLSNNNLINAKVIDNGNGVYSQESFNNLFINSNVSNNSFGFTTLNSTVYLENTFLDNLGEFMFFGSNNFFNFYYSDYYNSIEWKNLFGNSSLNQKINLEESISFKNNYVYVNSSNLPIAFNSSANIILNLSNTNITHPKPLLNNQLCTNCNVISFENNTISFQVQHFSNYSINQSFCGDGYCSIVDDCNSCPQDCGECPTSSSSTTNTQSTSPSTTTPSTQSTKTKTPEPKKTAPKTEEPKEEDTTETPFNIFETRYLIYMSLALLVLILIIFVSFLIILNKNKDGEIIVEKPKFKYTPQNKEPILNNKQEKPKQKIHKKQYPQKINPQKIKKALNLKDLSSIKKYIEDVSKNPKERITYFLECGKNFIENKDHYRAKIIYSYIFNEYKNLKIHNEGLYQKIILFRLSIPS